MVNSSGNVIKSSALPSTDVQIFTTEGSGTWTKPTWFTPRFVQVVLVGGGGGLLVMALVEEENITVEEADLDARYEKLANGNPDLVQRIKDFYSTQDNVKNSMTAEIKEDKAIDFLLQNATVTEVDAADLAEQPKAE
jgi:hypothetical protein